MDTLTWTAIAVAVALLVGMEVYLYVERKRTSRREAYLWTQSLDRVRATINDPIRLESMEEVRRRLTGQHAFLDMICKSTAVALKSPRSVITLIDAESQTFIAHHAVNEEEDTDYDTELPLSSTYCQFTVAADRTLVINNARVDPLVKDNPCTTDLGMRAYLGTPVCSKEGFPVGSLCVFDFTPRRWDRRDIAVIEAFAALVSL